MSTKAVYGWMLEKAGGNELLLAVVGSWLALNVTFWGLNGLLLYNDMTGRFGWLMKYKVQENKGAWMDHPKLKKAFKVAITVMVVAAGPNAVGTFYVQKYLGCSFRVEDTPSIPSLVVQVALIIVSQEILFYFSHRLLHHPYLYKRVHKMHHEWTAPIGLVSIYAHPVEQFVSNSLSILVGPLLMRCHIFVFFVWYCTITFITIAHHSGYHLPFCPSPEFHDYHHLKFHSNYGTWGWLDYLLGTEWQYGDCVQKQRNKPLLGFEPISNQIPGTTKSNSDSKLGAAKKSKRKKINLEYEH